MTETLTDAQRQRLYALWDQAQADKEYKAMLEELRNLESRYELVIEKLDDAQRDTVCDYVSLCEAMSWRVLELASQKMVFRFEKE